MKNSGILKFENKLIFLFFGTKPCLKSKKINKKSACATACLNKTENFYYVITIRSGLANLNNFFPLIAKFV